MTSGEIYGNTAVCGGGVFIGGGFIGNQKIGGTSPGAGIGWIHSNTDV
jgi:hypothetical protein